MSTRKEYTDRSNCRRAAMALIKAGTAPSGSFDVAKTEGGKFFVQFLDAQGNAIEGAAAAIEQAVAAIEAQTEESPVKKPRKPAAKKPAQPRSKRARRAAAAEEPVVRDYKGLPRLRIKSAANPSYQARANALLNMAAAGERNALKKLEIGGVNTYAKMLRRYRGQLLDAMG